MLPTWHLTPLLATGQVESAWLSRGNYGKAQDFFYVGWRAAEGAADIGMQVRFVIFHTYDLNDC